MSSIFVRDKVKKFITEAMPTETLVDLTADFQELEDLLDEAGVAEGGGPWIGIQFIGSEELPIDVGATNTKGTYRESGVIFIHVVNIARIGGHNGILARTETLRNKLRGIRIADKIIIESVSPATFGSGATLSFEGGYTSALVQVDYHTDVVLS